MRNRLHENTAYFRTRLSELGLSVLPGSHPIVPIMIGDARDAERYAQILVWRGLYVVAFSYPVVPQGLARIRMQISAAHSREDLDFALEQLSCVIPSLPA